MCRIMGPKSGTCSIAFASKVSPRIFGKRASCGPLIYSSTRRRRESRIHLSNRTTLRISRICAWPNVSGKPTRSSTALLIPRVTSPKPWPSFPPELAPRLGRLLYRTLCARLSRSPAAISRLWSWRFWIWIAASSGCSLRRSPSLRARRNPPSPTRPRCASADRVRNSSRLQEELRRKLFRCGFFSELLFDTLAFFGHRPCEFLLVCDKLLGDSRIEGCDDLSRINCGIDRSRLIDSHRRHRYPRGHLHAGEQRVNSG